MRPRLVKRRTVAALLVGGLVGGCQVIGGIDERVLASAPEPGSTLEAAAPDAAPTCAEGLCSKTVAAGDAFTCSREADGRVRCWGANDRGQLGDPSTTDRKDPAFVIGVAGVTDLWAGSDFACARLFDGRASCWGSNVSGELGDPELRAFYRARPGAVPGLAGVRELALGTGHACALTNDAVLCWGDNQSGECAQDPDVKCDSPRTVPGLTSSVVEIAAGGRTSCALRADGSVWCWGDNRAGQLATGTRTSTPTPTMIAGLAPSLHIGMGDGRVCAALRDGTLWCWGGADDADAGPPPPPKPVAGVAKARDGVALGAEHTCALTKEALLVCWGYDGNGQLGRDRSGEGAALPVPSLTGIAAFDLGARHTCARLAAGELYCWGANERGQLGEGSTTDQYHPMRVLSL